ncbi:hypothetical protein O3M35_004479 [Rhynocoris fuscipes]|uniref:TBC domain-containing protein kinase-like protein n=1 Tax=Rhynocoris fuscipes TaxID=488301 RepID=A0AAW1CFX5_9HEMI
MACENYYFACTTFTAEVNDYSECCGTNGLPLTPNSIKILGRAQFLKTLSHLNLVTYVDILRGKHDRIVIVTEKIGTLLKDYKFSHWTEILEMAKDILEGLSYLHKNGIIHRSLSPTNICKSQNTWRMFNFGLYYMTGNGDEVMFKPGELKYTCPSTVLNDEWNHSSFKDDIWSLGVILSELILDTKFWQSYNEKYIVEIFGKIVEHNGSIFKFLAKEAGKENLINNFPEYIIKFLDRLLEINPGKRPLSIELLNDDIFNILRFGYYNEYNNINNYESRLGEKWVHELYHYWEIGGGDVLNELKKNGLVKIRVPILYLPHVLLLEGRYFGIPPPDRELKPSFPIGQLDATGLLNRLRELKNAGSPLANRVTQNLPLIIKEKDTEYQYFRIQLFLRIIKDLPNSREELIKESKKDIPPFLRAQIWAHLLQVPNDYKAIYSKIDKVTPLPTDRQIEVDIPRCHQYDELLSSHEAHFKFKRILKAWVTSNRKYVYWQGLDSLAAPFLHLNFNDEALAFATLSQFVAKYLNNFFLQDNSEVIKEYLIKLKQLLAFHDPKLANHLHNIDFSPELFAIPWFLTMFSHIFAINKIVYLWDTLILGDSSYPFYIGLAMLKQMRNLLLESGFNECILIFSDLPDTDIERCVQDSITYYKSTPSSVTCRFHQPQSSHGNLNDALPVPIAELEKERSPRISPKDFHKLMRKTILRSKICVIDIRSHDLYSKLKVIDSINIPYTSGKLDGHQIINTLSAHRGKIIVVIGAEIETSFQFCNSLVEIGVSKVCNLNGGMAALLTDIEFADILRRS